MNKFQVTSAIIAMLCACNVSATKYIFTAGDDTQATKMCVATGNNDKSKLKRIIKQTKNASQIGTLRKIANHTYCNDMIIANFAYKYAAIDTFKYLNRVTKSEYQMLRPNVTIRDLAMVDSKNEVIKITLVAGN
jgi:hypothetical protein